MTTPAAIQIDELRVDYGDFTAVKDLCMEVARGEIFGFVGPNGAGKTSTLKVVSTLLYPTYGSVMIAGIDALEDSRAARQKIGYMPDLAPVPSDLFAWEFLDFYAQSYGVYGSKQHRREAVDQALEEVELTEQRKAKCNALSRGQTQRLVFAKTILQQPEILILDEPASGLDPLSRRNLKHTLKRIAADGATVIVSSHILSELAEYCTSLCILNQGQLLIQGTAEHIRDAFESTQRSLDIRFTHLAQDAAAWLREHPRVSHVDDTQMRLSCDFSGTLDDQAQLLTDLVARGYALRSVEEKHNSFEDILTRIAEENHS